MSSACKRAERRGDMLLAKTRKIKNAGQKSSFGARWFHTLKSDSVVPPETELDDEVKMTLDEQIESLERMQKLIRQLAAEQGVFLKDDEQ